MFNWLQPRIAGARCLDLFAGTGALGLEALSRGAGEVVFVESAGRVMRHLQQQVQRLPVADRVQLVESSAQSYLASSPRLFDLVFIDPPWAEALQEQMLRLLTAGWLSTGAWVYVECEAGQCLDEVPGYALRKQKRIGQAQCHLFDYGD
ncbi:MAG: hypothetical protein Tsb002_06150 [Wenzhouxiangellaceae bacterium]